MTVRRRRRRRRAQRAGRRQPPGRRAAGRCSCSRRSPTSAAPSAAPRTCTRASCTTRSARSTRWPRPRRRSGRFDLEEHGLRWRARAGRARPPAAPTARWALLHRDREVDGRAWSRRSTPATARPGSSCAAQWDRIGDAADRARCSRRSRRSGRRSRLLARLPLGRRARLRQDAADPGRRRSAATRFGGDAPRGCCSPATPGTPTSRSTRPGSGLMGLLMTMLGQTVGFPVPEGGAGQLTAGAGRGASRPRRRDPLLARRSTADRRRDGPRDRRAHRATASGIARPARRARRRRRAAACTAASLAPDDLPARVRARRCAASSSTRRRSRSTGRSSGPVPWALAAGVRARHRARRRLRRRR